MVLAGQERPVLAVAGEHPPLTGRGIPAALGHVFTCPGRSSNSSPFTSPSRGDLAPHARVGCGIGRYAPRITAPPSIRCSVPALTDVHPCAPLRRSYVHTGGMRARAPGRVNLIGDHTDYTGGFAMPAAIDRGTEVEIEIGGDWVELVSDVEPEAARVPVDVEDPGAVQPPWARYVAGVVAVVRPRMGGRGAVCTTLPVGAGLSSSAALEVALALALGFEGTPLELALAGQRSEHLASGVPSGMMDQLASVSGRAGHALLIDCSSYEVEPVPMPDGVDILVVHSGQSRTLVGSAYSERRGQCEAAAQLIGPLRDAVLADADGLADPVLRKRARHVVTENERVLAFAEALRGGDIPAAGRLMVQSHESLRDDFEVSTTALDDLVDKLVTTPGVYGARLTGAGFGGCVVALAEPSSPAAGWRLSAADGASVLAG
ncbi:MAG: galactokinase [Acidimicrobiales bacterium]